MTESAKVAITAYETGATLQIPVLYLDIDGTVRHGKDELGKFVETPDEVVVFPEAVARMREWKSIHPQGRIVGVTNQGGVALGLQDRRLTWQGLEETMRQTDGLMDAIFACFHHPKAKDPYAARCWCRKPNSGAIAEAAQLLRSMLDPTRLHTGYPSGHSVVAMPASLGIMVGDRPEDKECAELAGLRFIWADRWRAGSPYYGEAL